MNDQTEAVAAPTEEAKPVEMTEEERKAKIEALQKEQREKQLAHIATLKPAQQLAFKLGLPYQWPKDENGKFISPRRARATMKWNMRRKGAELAAKKKEHARRVGRPK